MPLKFEQFVRQGVNVNFGRCDVMFAVPMLYYGGTRRHRHCPLVYKACGVKAAVANAGSFH